MPSGSRDARESHEPTATGTYSRQSEGGGLCAPYLSLFLSLFLSGAISRLVATRLLHVISPSIDSKRHHERVGNIFRGTVRGKANARKCRSKKNFKWHSFAVILLPFSKFTKYQFHWCSRALWIEIQMKSDFASNIHSILLIFFIWCRNILDILFLLLNKGIDLTLQVLYLISFTPFLPKKCHIKIVIKLHLNLKILTLTRNVFLYIILTMW